MTRNFLLLFLILIIGFFIIISQIIRTYYHHRIESSSDVFLQFFETRLQKSQDYYQIYSQNIKNQELKNKIENYLKAESKFIDELKSY